MPSVAVMSSARARSVLIHCGSSFVLENNKFFVDCGSDVSLTRLKRIMQ